MFPGFSGITPETTVFGSIAYGDESYVVSDAPLPGERPVRPQTARARSVEITLCSPSGKKPSSEMT